MKSLQYTLPRPLAPLEVPPRPPPNFGLASSPGKVKAISYNDHTLNHTGKIQPVFCPPLKTHSDI